MGDRLIGDDAAAQLDIDLTRVDGVEHGRDRHPPHDRPPRRLPALGAHRPGRRRLPRSRPSLLAHSCPPPIRSSTRSPDEGRYAAGVTADLVFEGSGATLDVTNASGAELAAPSLYVIDGSGAHRDGVVADSAPIPDGESATFDVTFPDGVTDETIGLVDLLFGDSNYGLLAPVPLV